MYSTIPICGLIKLKRSISARLRRCIPKSNVLFCYFTEETVLQRKVSDKTFQSISKHFSHEQLVELAIAEGCYMMGSIFFNTFEVDIEEKDAPF